MVLHSIRSIWDAIHLVDLIKIICRGKFQFYGVFDALRELVTFAQLLINPESFFSQCRPHPTYSVVCLKIWMFWFKCSNQIDPLHFHSKMWHKMLQRMWLAKTAKFYQNTQISNLVNTQQLFVQFGWNTGQLFILDFKWSTASPNENFLPIYVHFWF